MRAHLALFALFACFPLAACASETSSPALDSRDEDPEQKAGTTGAGSGARPSGEPLRPTVPGEATKPGAPATEPPPATAPTTPSGSEDPDPEPTPPVDPVKPGRRVFVTKSGFNGDLKMNGGGVDGPTGADNLCQGAANFENLGGVLKAWISTPTVNAIDRLTDASPWYLVDRKTLVFATKGQLMTTPSHKIDQDEAGPISSGSQYFAVWTATNLGGSRAIKTCEGWTTSRSDASAFTGNYSETRSYWTASPAADPCSWERHLYCFEQ